MTVWFLHTFSFGFCSASLRSAASSSSDTLSTSSVVLLLNAASSLFKRLPLIRKHPFSSYKHKQMTQIYFQFLLKIWSDYALKFCIHYCSELFVKYFNIFIQQGCVKLIKSYSKDFPFQINAFYLSKLNPVSTKILSSITDNNKCFQISKLEWFLKDHDVTLKTGVIAAKNSASSQD